MSNGDLLQVNAGTEAILLDVEKICAAPTASTSSPIDEYYEHARDLVVRTSGADALILRLLLLDLISATELYFRRVLAGAINVCPVIRDVSSRQMLSLGAVYYYDEEGLGYGVLEHAALSGEGEVKKKTLAITGLQWKTGSSVDAAIAGFDRICHLRHAAIHSHGELSARNLAELGMTMERRRRLALDAIAFQQVMATCHNAVRAYNQFLCNGVLGRWIDRGLLAGTFDEDQKLFAPLHTLLISVEDATSPAKPEEAYVQILPLIVARTGGAKRGAVKKRHEGDADGPP